MIRVPADTVLSRFLTATALAATLALSACGDDTPETATTPVVPSTPAATTVTGTTDVPVTTTGPDAEAVTNDNAKKELTREESEAATAKTKKAAQEASKGLSSKPKSDDDLTEQVKRANDALKAGGFKVERPAVDDREGVDEDGVSLTVEQFVTVVFMRSPRNAAAAQAVYETNFAESPQKLKFSRKANRLFILNSPTDPTPAQLKRYRQVRKVVNGAV